MCGAIQPTPRASYMIALPQATNALRRTTLSRPPPMSMPQLQRTTRLSSSVMPLAMSST